MCVCQSSYSLPGKKKKKKSTLSAELYCNQGRSSLCGLIIIIFLGWYHSPLSNVLLPTQSKMLWIQYKWKRRNLWCMKTANADNQLLTQRHKITPAVSVLLGQAWCICAHKLPTPFSSGIRCALILLTVDLLQCGPCTECGHSDHYWGLLLKPWSGRGLVHLAHISQQLRWASTVNFPHELCLTWKIKQIRD